MVRTWVAEFRRVRSLRRYELRDAAGGLRAEAATDWIYVDAESGKPRRLPAEVEARFGVVADEPAREAFVAWGTASPPPGAIRTEHRVLLDQLDPVGHVNNAAYLDVVVQAFHDALAARDWPLAGLVDAGAVPTLVHVDLEYLNEARFGDVLSAETWTQPGGDPIVRQVLFRTGGTEVCLRAATRWAWMDPRSGSVVPAPEEISAALASREGG